MHNDTKPTEKLIRQKVAGLPLLMDIIERMELRRILVEAMGEHGNETFPAVDTLILLILNLALGKQPLYELEQWVQSVDLRCLGYKDSLKGRFNDDRFGRALDKLYNVDRASLMTRLVTEVVKTFELQMDRIHNDSTSLKACGRYPGKNRHRI